MSDFEINFKEDKLIWNDFVLSSPQRSIFVYSKFLDSLFIHYNLVTCYENERIVAGAIILYSETGEPINSTFPFTQYQGILLSDNTHKAKHSQITHEFKVVEYFLKKLTDCYSNFSFCHSWRLNDLRPFQWFNYHKNIEKQFRINLKYTGILDLTKFTDFENYLSTVRAVRRQEFNKSSRLSFKFSNSISTLDLLHKKTFDRQNIERDITDSRLLKSISCSAILNGYGKLGIVFLDKTPISASLFLYDDRTAYYLFGANDPEYRKFGSGTFLLMCMIKDAMQQGISEIDFCGINSPNRGDFKISFNAEPKPFFICTYND